MYTASNKHSSYRSNFYFQFNRFIVSFVGLGNVLCIGNQINFRQYRLGKIEFVLTIKLLCALAIPGKRYLTLRGYPLQFSTTFESFLFKKNFSIQYFPRKYFPINFLKLKWLFCVNGEKTLKYFTKQLLEAFIHFCYIESQEGVQKKHRKF